MRRGRAVWPARPLILAAGEQALDVLDADQDDECHEDGEAGQVDECLALRGQLASTCRLEQDDRDPSAVERRERPTLAQTSRFASIVGGRPGSVHAAGCGGVGVVVLVAEQPWDSRISARAPSYGLLERDR